MTDSSDIHSSILNALSYEINLFSRCSSPLKKSFDYVDANYAEAFRLSSLTTLCVENFFSEMRQGNDMPLVLQFCYRFSSCVKERLKGLTDSSDIHSSILNALSYEINLFSRCSSPLKKSFDYVDANYAEAFRLSSLTTLCVENFFSEMRQGNDMPLVLQFCYRFSSCVKERLKSSTKWGFIYQMRKILLSSFPLF